MEKITEISGPVHNEKFWIGDTWLAYLYLVISSFSVIHFFHYYLYFVYICVVCPCVYAVPTEASRGHQSLGLELQKVVCLYVGAWNWTITNMDINAQTILIWEANIFSLWGKMCMNYIYNNLKKIYHIRISKNRPVLWSQVPEKGEKEGGTD